MADAQARLVISAQDKTAPDIARVKNGLEGLNTSAQGLGAVLSGAAIGISAALAAAAGAASAFRGILDGVDALNDLKDATGASIENLSGLERVAKLNGGTLETVSGIIVKFNRGLKDADGENGVSRALKAIGLDAEKLRTQDPALALQATAQALAKFEDGADKARVVQELFGKSIREAAPFLKDLAESGQLNATVTTEQAEAAEKFNKQLFALKTAASEAARGIVGDMLPALSRALQVFNEFRNGPGLGSLLLEGLKGNSFSNAQEGLNAYSKKIAGINEEIQKIATSKGPDFLKRDSIAPLEAKRKELEKFAASYRNLLPAEYGNEGRNYQAPKQAIPTGALKAAAKGPAAPNGDAEFTALIDRLNKKAAATAQELSLGRKLTESEALQADVTAQLTGQKTKLTEAQQASVRQALAGAVANAKALEQQQELAKTTKAITDLEAQRYAQLSAGVEQAAARNDALREELAAVGATAEQLEAMATARLRDAAARQAINIVMAQNAGASVAEIDLMERELALLKETAAIRGLIAGKTEAQVKDPVVGATTGLNEYLKTVANAGESTRQAVAKTLGELENGLTDALTGKGFDIKEFVNNILREVVRLNVVRPLLASIFGGGPAGGASPGAVSIFSALFGGFGGKFANGGHLGAGKWGIAGEAGPEIIKGPAEVVPMSRMPSGLGAAGGGPTIVQNIVVNGGNRNELMAGMQQARRAAVADIQELQRRGRA